MERPASLPQRSCGRFVGSGGGWRELEKRAEGAPGPAVGGAGVHERGVRNENHPDLQLGHMGQKGQLPCPEAPGAGLSPPELHCSQGNGVHAIARGQALTLTVCLPPSPTPSANSH